MPTDRYPTRDVAAPAADDAPTALVPTDVYPVPTQPRPRPAVPGMPAPGQRLGDFELLHVLGEGSFGCVFLARQVSLGRQVALKVSADRGNEARTLASLEHGHIVQVFLETVDRERGLRLLCMQYVPGTTLERVIGALSWSDARQWDGRAFLAAVDALSAHPPAFDPTALRDREALAGAGWEEMVCRLGARLAEALAYAHRQGVLHRDIKPANVLVNPYGRPLLADFNVALGPTRERGPSGEIFGGTLGYMAPEHLDALNPDDPTPPSAVDQRSDIYGLGVVLYELLTGRPPFTAVRRQGDLGDTLRVLAEQRRAAAPGPRLLRPATPPELDRAIRRCLAPDPARRFQTAGDLAETLDGCRELDAVRRRLPAPGPLCRAALRRPLLWVALLAVLPHVVGSVVNVTYNAQQIVGDLTAAQQAAFARLVLGYNLIVYPLALGMLAWVVVGPLRVWRRLADGGDVAETDVAAARRGVLTWPAWALAASCLGWLPGGVLFPLGIGLLSQPVPAAAWAHFLVSFTISGLIAVTYSFFGVQFVVLRVLYPQLWVEPRDVCRQSAAELDRLRPRPQTMQLLAGTIPLAAALLMVAGGPALAESVAYRLLVAGLIVLGMAGFGLAVLATGLLTQTRAVLTGSEGRLAGTRRAAPPPA